MSAGVPRTGPGTALDVTVDGGSLGSNPSLRVSAPVEEVTPGLEEAEAKHDDDDPHEDTADAWDAALDAGFQGWSPT